MMTGLVSIGLTLIVVRRKTLYQHCNTACQVKTFDQTMTPPICDHYALDQWNNLLDLATFPTPPWYSTNHFC